MAVQQFVFKNWSVYIGDAKHGHAQKATLDLPTGNESVVCDDGHVGVTKGKRTSKLSLTSYVSLAGRPEQDALRRAYLTGETVTVNCGVLMGKIWKIPMQVMSLKFDSDMVKGGSMMDAELEGGVPDFAG